jgi:hypothetical protein
LSSIPGDEAEFEKQSQVSYQANSGSFEERELNFIVLPVAVHFAAIIISEHGSQACAALVRKYSDIFRRSCTLVRPQGRHSHIILRPTEDTSVIAHFPNFSSVCHSQYKTQEFRNFIATNGAHFITNTSHHLLGFSNILFLTFLRCWIRAGIICTQLPISFFESSP